jgi:predicted RNA-binding protein YlxR (DUF448 family)
VSERLITLDAWAARRYADKPPHEQTLRRWARKGLIHPTPQKHGRAYYVEPDAEYLSDTELVRRLSVPKAS